MKPARYRTVMLPLLTALLLSSAVSVRGEGLAPLRLGPEEIRLTVDASRPGAMGMATLAGDMGKAGLYAARVLIPAGLKVQPHVHPEDRMVVVLSGTLHVGFGHRFEPASMKPLPPGSFFTEPAGQPHYAWAQSGDVLLQVSGIGPSGTVYVQPERRTE